MATTKRVVGSVRPTKAVSIKLQEAMAAASEELERLMGGEARKIEVRLKFRSGHTMKHERFGGGE